MVCVTPKTHERQDDTTVFSRLNAPGVYFKPGPEDRAFIWSRRLIGARGLLTMFFFFFFFFLPFYQVDLLSPNLRDPSKVVQDGTIFPLVQFDKLSLGLLQVTVTIAYSMNSYYRMLQSRCVKKNKNK